MKKFKYILASLLIIPIAFLFVGCNDNNNNNDPPAPPPPADTVIQLTSDNIVLETTDYFYTGQTIEPTVKVVNGSTEIEASNYEVTYANNLNVGTAEVIVTATSGSTVIKGSATKNFNILERVSHVTTIAELETELMIDNNTIILDNDINYTSTTDFMIDFMLSSQDSKIVLDLNNHTLKAGLNVTNLNEDTFDEYTSGNISMFSDIFYKFSLDLTIKNGTLGNSEIQSDFHCLSLACSGNGDIAFNIQLDHVNLVGYDNCITTDARCSEATLSATDCTFNTTCQTSGSPIQLNSAYQFTFYDSSFEGYRAFEVARGTMMFEGNVTATATGDTLAHIQSNYNPEEESGYGIDPYITFIINSGTYECTKKDAVIITQETGEEQASQPVTISIYVFGANLITNTDNVENKTKCEGYIQSAESEDLTVMLGDCYSSTEHTDGNRIEDYPAAEE